MKVVKRAGRACGRRPPRPPPGSPARPRPPRRRSRPREWCRTVRGAAGWRCRRGRARRRSTRNCWSAGGSAWRRMLAHAGRRRRASPASCRGRTSPKNSAWSVTAAKSSGRSMCALRVCCLVVVARRAISPPRAKSYASRGADARPEDVGVGGEARVDVQVAEDGCRSESGGARTARAPRALPGRAGGRRARR